MKYVTTIALLAAMVLLFAAASTLGAEMPTPHAQLSSAVDQQPDADGEVFMLELEDSVSGMNVYTDADGTSLEVLYPGLYVTVFVPQVTFDGGKAKCYTAWSRLNGVDVPNSNIQLCQQGNWSTMTQTQQAVGCYAAGDVIEFMHSADAPGIYADAITVPGQPLVPTAITSVWRDGSC